MEEPMKATLKLVQTYTNELTKSFKNLLNSYQPKDHKDIAKFSLAKNKLIGPTLLSLRMHIAELSSITKNLNLEFNEWKDLLNQINSFTIDNNIDASNSMADFWQLDFTMGINEMFCGNFHKDGSFGVWTDGKEIYKGEFSNKKKHGYGFMIFNDGSVFEGKFNQGNAVYGKWKLETGEDFLGRVNKEEKWMIGIKKKDIGLEGEKEINNCLYFKGEKTILKNILPDQDIDISSLRGTNQKSCIVKWEDGVQYEGYWEDFNPICGVFSFENEKIENSEETKKIRVFGNNGILLPIKDINPKSIEEIRTCTNVKLEFMNGVRFEGEINPEMEIKGFGLVLKKEGGKSCGLFTSSYMGTEFKIDDEDTWKFLEKKPIGFFRDSQEFMELRPDMKELPKLKLKNPAKTRETNFYEYWYKGHWKNYRYIDGLCEVTIGDKTYKGYCDEGIILSVSNMKASELFSLGMKQGMANQNRRSNKCISFVNLIYLDGKKYYGQMDIERFIVEGYGCLKLSGNKVIMGLWEKDKCVVEFEEVDGSKDMDINTLKNGEHEIKLKTGKIVTITFEEFEIKDGYTMEGDKKEKFDSFVPSADYYNGKSEKFDFKLILVLHSQMEILQQASRDNIFKTNILDKEYDLLWAYNILEKKKFTGVVSKKNPNFKNTLMKSRFMMKPQKKTARQRQKNSINIPVIINSTIKKNEKITELKLSEDIIYDERNLELETKLNLMQDVKKFSERSYFKKRNYQSIKNENPESENLIGFGEKVEVKFDEELKKLKPQKSYIQITTSGMFKTHSDLFNYLADEETDGNEQNRSAPLFQNISKFEHLNFLQKDEHIKFALYELNKLNGIAEVNQNSIKFYNGDEYIFENGERNFEKSLGSIVKYMGKEKSGNVKKEIQHFYWKRFFNESLINNFDEKFFEEEIKGKIDSTCLKGGNRTLLKFNDDIKLETTWANFIIMGNSTYTRYQKELKRPVYDYGAISKKSGGEAVFEIISPKLLGSKGIDILTLIFSSISHKMKLFPREWVKGNDFRKLKMNPKQAFSIKLNKKADQPFLETIMGAMREINDANGLKPIEVSYTNGDLFKGYCSSNLSKEGEGVYKWNEGFSYTGKFFANNPYGWGQYTDCLGVVRKGYFFRGFLLETDYGLEKLKIKLKEKFSKEGSLTVNGNDLKLLTDSDLIMGSQMFLDCPISFRRMYTDIEKSRKIFITDLKNIKEGELDYTHNWEDRALVSMSSLVLKTKITKRNNEVNFAENTAGMSMKLQMISRRKEVINQEKMEKEISSGRHLSKTSGVDFDAIEKKKEENKYSWINDINLKKVKHFEKESIIEMVKDEDFIGLEKLFNRYSKAKLINKFLNIKDAKSRNILMISAFYGRIQIFIDVLSVMIQAARKGLLSKKDLKKNLLHRDYEGNNTVDLLSIQGFDGEDELTISKKLDSKIIWEDGIFKEIEKVKLKPDNSAVESNQIYNSIIEMLKNIDRKLFIQNFMTYEKLGNYVNSIRSDDKTSDLIFLSKRTICLFTLFEAVKKIGDIDLLPQKFYDEKRSNPTHFTLFHGDLHATIQILKYKFDILLWRNSEGELPPQVIKWSGVNYYQAKAVFASILREFTRNFNLKVINELLLADDRILKAQKEKSIHKFEVEEKEEKERVEKMKAMLEEKNFFDPENVYLYCNNYVLLSDELSKQYVNFIKEKSRFRQSKTDHRIQKKFTFVKNSELESLQKNFLDYYQGTFIGYHDKKIEDYYRETVQEILTWYAYIYGDAEINPQIYTLLDIDAFEPILDGRNLFHFMCQNNSYCLLEDFLEYHYEKCHKRPFDPSKDDYREWDKEIDEEKLNELQEKLMYQTKTNQNTPAHLCAINQSEECLDLLVKYNVDLEAINLRGRTVIEILEKEFKEDFVEMKQFTPSDISVQVVEYVKNEILSCCKQHSIKYKYLKGVKNRDEGLKKIFTNSVFSLTKELSQNRDSILKDTEMMMKGKINSRSDLMLYAFFIININQINKSDEEKKFKFKNEVFEKLEELLKDENLKKENSKIDLRNMPISINGKMEYDQIVTLLRSFIYHFNKGIQISTQNYLKLLFDFRVLKNFKNFKYKKFEMMMKKELLNKLEKVDLLEPLTTDIKDNLSLDRLLCIEVRNKESDYIQSHPVVVQLNNLKKKYSEYSGGFIIDIIRGYPVKVNKEITWYNPITWFNLCCNKATEIKWFILINASRELLEKVATDDQMKTYNMKQEFHTLFYKDSISPEELEPLRHFQKMKILMKLIKEEFNIENFKKDGIIKSYFPIHNYTKRKALEKLWSKHKFTTHFFDIFVSKTRDTTLQIFSLIAFYHGIQQGFYFGFLSLYNNSLFLLAFIGVIGTYLQYIAQINRDFVIFSTALIVGAWSALFINTWKRREKELAYSFDTYEEDNIKQERDEYKGEYTIDRGTLKIQKKREILYFRQFIFTLTWFTIGVSCTVLIYLLINYLNQTDLVKNNEFVGTIVTGILNGTLNFIVSLVYEYGVNILVKWENHVYAEKMRVSLILKTQIFKVFSQVFTLVVQSIFIVETDGNSLNYDNFTTQILSNLVTSAVLNYGLSVGLPIFLYLKQRFFYISYLLLCKWLCCKNRRGKLDDFRERTIVKMLASKVGRVAFLRYCTKEGKITKEMEEKVESYKKEKIDKEKKEKKKNKITAKQPDSGYEFIKNIEHSDTHNLELRMYKGDEYNIPSPSGFSEEDTNQILKDLVEKVKVHRDYKGKAEILGSKRRKNIGLRLKEEFSKFVLGREQTIESSYMIDLGTLEIGFYSSLLSQFTFICFFSQFLVSAGLVSYILNLLIIFLTIRIYTRVSRRTVSRKVRNIGVWTKLFDLVSYLGIVYNTVIAVKYAKGLTAFTGKDVADSNEVFETEFIYRVQFGLLIFKFLYSILVPALPSWIKQRISRENLVLARNSKILTQTLNRFRNEFKNYEEMFEDEDSASLKHFFKNEDPIKEFEVPEIILKKLVGNENFRKQKAMTVVKAKKKLL